MFCFMKQFFSASTVWRQVFISEKAYLSQVEENGCYVCASLISVIQYTRGNDELFET